MRTPLLALFALLALTGCASQRVADDVDRAPARVPLVFTGAGEATTLDAVAENARRFEAILVGENHGHPLGLQTAAELWSKVLERAPSAALAMEFFERDEQAALDDYLAGITDEAGFRKAAARTEGNYPDGHRAMIEAAKAGKRPVEAANAPRRYVRLARSEGFDRLRALTPEQARLVRIPDSLPTGAYRAAFDAIMATPHAPPTSAPGATPPPPETPEEKQKRLDAGFRSQSTWDWTMAESVARSVQAGRTPTMLVVGRFRIERHPVKADGTRTPGDEGGTTLALQAMRPRISVLTVTFVNEWPEDGRLRAEDQGRADVVVYVGPDPTSR